jgi:hypothetical protein
LCRLLCSRLPATFSTNHANIETIPHQHSPHHFQHSPHQVQTKQANKQTIKQTNIIANNQTNQTLIKPQQTNKQTNNKQIIKQTIKQKTYVFVLTTISKVCASAATSAAGQPESKQYKHPGNQSSIHTIKQRIIQLIKQTNQTNKLKQPMNQNHPNRT